MIIQPLFPSCKRLVYLVQIDIVFVHDLPSSYSMLSKSCVNPNSSIISYCDTRVLLDNALGEIMYNNVKQDRRNN